MDALFYSLQRELERFSFPLHSVNSLYIGGGTPSVVSSHYYEKIFDYVTPYLATNAEVSIEANPLSATPQWLASMKSLGVNRLSLGIQSFDDEKLRFLGRSHSSKHAFEALEAAERVGLNNVSIDIMYDTMWDNTPFLERELASIEATQVTHLSAYSLTLEPHTHFDAKEEYLQKDLEAGERFLKELEERGFERYEVSNFGSPRSQHNCGYWQHHNYLGVGAGAVGFLNHQRLSFHHSVEDFINNIDDVFVESITPEELRLEKIFLGLRCFYGVAQETLLPLGEQKAHWLIDEGKLRYDSGRYYCTNYQLADEIALFLSE